MNSVECDLRVTIATTQSDKRLSSSITINRSAVYQSVGQKSNFYYEDVIRFRVLLLIVMNPFMYLRFLLMSFILALVCLCFKLFDARYKAPPRLIRSVYDVTRDVTSAQDK